MEKTTSDYAQYRKSIFKKTDEEIAAQREERARELESEFNSRRSTESQQSLQRQRSPVNCSNNYDRTALAPMREAYNTSVYHPQTPPAPNRSVPPAHQGAYHPGPQRQNYENRPAPNPMTPGSQDSLSTPASGYGYGTPPQFNSHHSEQSRYPPPPRDYGQSAPVDNSHGGHPPESYR